MISRSATLYKIPLLSSRKQFWRNVGTVDTKRAAKKLRNATWNDFKSIFSLALPHKKRILRTSSGLLPNVTGYLVGLGFLGVSSSIFLISPRVLGKVLDEYNDSKKKEPVEGEEKDLSLRLAKYFKENPSHILPLFFLGAVAICARAYCMHTAGKLMAETSATLEERGH